MSPVIAAFLIPILVIATAFDLKSRRIPNILILSGLILGLDVAGILGGATGLLHALAGSGLALLLTFPLYMLRIFGAGDVKLISVVGAFLGSGQILWALLTIFVAGGVLALTYAALRGGLIAVLRHVFTSVRMQFGLVSAGMLPASASKPSATISLPYAVAILMGTLWHLVRNASGFSPF